jgi:hypothetical protein
VKDTNNLRVNYRNFYFVEKPTHIYLLKCKVKYWSLSAASVAVYLKRNKDWKSIREYMEESQKLGNMVRLNLIKTDYGVKAYKN